MIITRNVCTACVLLRLVWSFRQYLLCCWFWRHTSISLLFIIHPLFLCFPFFFWGTKTFLLAIVLRWFASLQQLCIRCERNTFNMKIKILTSTILWNTQLALAFRSFVTFMYLNRTDTVDIFQYFMYCHCITTLQLQFG